MKKYLLLIISIAAISILLYGCSKDNTVENEANNNTEASSSVSEIKSTDDLMKNADQFPQLTKEEFLNIISGKTELSIEDFPSSKACLQDGEGFQCFIINNDFLLIISDSSIYSNIADNTENECSCTLRYYEDGIFMDAVSSIEGYAKFIEIYQNE